MNMHSLRLPPGWTVQFSTSSGTAGDVNCVLASFLPSNPAPLSC